MATVVAELQLMPGLSVSLLLICILNGIFPTEINASGTDNTDSCIDTQCKTSSQKFCCRTAVSSPCLLSKLSS
uniref:WAP domain-containing protein n=1 Tax=Anguilla anguilla TaxID=7936 RepID=A0A0E9RSL3_ANGAN